MGSLKVAQIADGLPIFALEGEAVGDLAFAQGDFPAEIRVARDGGQGGEGIGKDGVFALGIAGEGFENERGGADFSGEWRKGTCWRRRG